MSDRPIDRLVIAKLEMEERHFLGTAPIAAIERLRSDEIERTGDRLAVAASEEQQDGLAEPLADDIEKFAREIGSAPLPRPGILVEGPHRVPFGRTDLRAAQDADLQSIERRRPFLAQRLALAARQRAEEIIEGRKA